MLYFIIVLEDWFQSIIRNRSSFYFSIEWHIRLLILISFLLHKTEVCVKINLVKAGDKKG